MARAMTGRDASGGDGWGRSDEAGPEAGLALAAFGGAGRLPAGAGGGAAAAAAGEVQVRVIVTAVAPFVMVKVLPDFDIA